MLKKLSLKLMAPLAAAALLSACSMNDTAPKAPLSVDTYNPGTASLFPVSSNLISGDSEIMLVDAQFQSNDAENLVNKIKASGKTLKTIYISHYDPDYYFGLDVITGEFPEARVVATPATIKKIRETAEGKQAYWGPILKANAPEHLVYPEKVKGSTLTVDGEPIEIFGLKHDPSHTVLWIPSTKTIAGGVPVYENVHVWMADNQTPESRQTWLKTLDRIEALNPEKVIPGHYMGESAMDKSSIQSTREYIAAFDEQAAVSKNSADLIKRMTQLYPEFSNIQDLELSAKVVMGEMKWPQ
ncbi:MBL fold metallo-hydrolase [Spongorhabdus nitratireducens]